MNKLFKLKKWLTLDEAARRLSSSAEEPISVADVLRLALDGELVLSVDFVNHARAQPWVKTPRDRAKTLTYDPKLMGLEGEPEEIFAGFAVSQYELLQPVSVDAPVRLQGVYDLAMWGSEALDVENMYQELTDGPLVELMNIEGAFVKGENDEYYQILESYEDNGYMQGSRANLENIESRILLQALNSEEAKNLRERYMESRVSFLESASKSRGIDNYYPASGLPLTCRLVVRNAVV
ncbi:hypothetical protein RA263_25990 [Pseudomonas syringae pv. tagetis]|uniref:Uncharacterized protein n=1 Tax=Pseudomonas syringae pv. tagetis TaxID=129140 RepID=A0A0Q0BAL8_9PSED|nr:hypothetical protein [Pseudomonas syringae group genomosp. 7]KPY85518.1 Uncharacterized protein ALO44_04085 [Pseudomonas syringae pv. tagetis]RMW10795.1 hypothetical protein ALO98_200145 [Pseudomonas syringae pv. tagetis]RMW25987.1 hypothetical protein ALO97_00835 [Pseudomonas syringae pv. tagetis]UNB69506.1 hypothetical protein MME58_04460 [Pseudomonas syringae pv. tagetis]